MRIDQQISSESFSQMKQPMGKVWPGFLISGLFTMVLGIAAILVPFIATMTIEAFLAAILIIAGIIHLVHAFQVRHSKGLGWRLLSGALYILIGILLVSYPLHGVMTLTILLALLFIFSGIFKIALSLRLHHTSKWGWLLFNGILSLLLGIVIWSGLPGTARWAIGLLVGIELLFTGWAMIMVSMAARHSENMQAQNIDFKS